jgi:glycerophosphoryl diester phosphodiesterase
MLVPATFRIIAHRGASAYAPENTHAAFGLAARMGITEIELDTQLTTDGQVALCHDSTLARYGHGLRPVEEMTWDELAALDMGAWFSPFLFGGERMITLDDLFATYGPSFTYHVEIKGKAPALPAAVYASILRHHVHSQCIVTSFQWDALVAMRELDAEMRLGWLIETVDAAALEAAHQLHLFQLCPRAKFVTPVLVDEARQSVPEVRAWGVQGENMRHHHAEVLELMHQVIASGCDGMTTNWPDWVAHAAAQ